MGSVITKLPGSYDQSSITGNKRPQLTFLQFVPGIVVSVVTGADSEKCEGQLGRIGSIRALPHIGAKGIKKKSMVGEEYRYYPLLRGMQEIPVSGDPVLLCTFGGRQYYLGPLNTQGSPNFNEDFFESDEIRSGAEKGKNKSEYKVPPLFIEKEYKRLQKLLNKELDNPLQEGEEFVSNVVHGDTILEGRHGNSIRLGSRNINPYLIISNGRSVHSIVETSLDGTIFGIFHRGNLRQHFNRDRKLVGEDIRTGDSVEDYKFTLADDELENVYRSISKSYNHHLGRGGAAVKDTEFNVEEKIYDYDKDQLFASSGRITFNARSDSIFLSAFEHVHIGCGNSMTFSTSKNILVEAQESVLTNTPLFKVNADKFVYIDGREKIVLGNPLLNDITHAAVLGDGLVTQLGMIIQEIKNLAMATSEAIENRKATGASVDILSKTIEALDELMGLEAGEGGNMYPKKMSDLILSKKVFIKI